MIGPPPYYCYFRRLCGRSDNGGKLSKGALEGQRDNSLFSKLVVVVDRVAAVDDPFWL